MTKKITILALIITFLVLSSLLLIINNRVNENKVIEFPVVSGIPKDFDVDKTSNIVFTTDGKYREYLKVALKSLVMNKNKDSYYNIYILCVDLKKKEMKDFKIFDSNKTRIHIISLKQEMLDNIFKKRINIFYVSNADLFKFFLPEIFKDLDRILYLDSDILVLGDLTKLYQTDIKDKYIAAVKRYNLDGTRKKDDYNCGVMLYNLKKCREEKITKKLIEAKNTNDDGRSSQYSFNNVITVNNIKPISPIYNNNASSIDKNDFNTYNFKKTYAPFLNSINNMDELDKQTIIAHFIGPNKPWHQKANLRFKKQWQEYALMVNPEFKSTQKTFFEKITIAYTMNTLSSTKKTPFKYIKKFLEIYENN